MSHKCSVCGKGRSLMKFKTNTGLYLCPGCYGLVPDDLAAYALDNWDKLDYEELKLAKETTSSLEFNETLRMGVISLDEKKGLYRLSSPDFTYSFNYLSEYMFGFEVEENGDGKKRTVDYVLRLKSDYPRHEITIPLIEGIKIPEDIKDEQLTDYLSQEAKDFNKRFNDSFQNYSCDALDQECTEEELLTEAQKAIDEVTNALKVMGYETLEGVSENGIKRRKQALIKPNKVMSLERIQEINAACDLLVQVKREMEEN